jgi:RNA polymerase sigma-70 factor (ECF subfamily)
MSGAPGPQITSTGVAPGFPAAAGAERAPDDAAVVDDDIDRLRDAFATLPDDQARAVVLAGVWGLTAREISERESIPLGTAKTRILIALRRLRVPLADTRIE